MSKEMIVSCSSHERKIAILEDDQVTELYFERGNEYGLAGSIYKGRVTRVLPGMQSAFVDIGLERDAFLYVSDFLEDTEEYDRIASTVEDKVIKMEENALGAVAPPPIAESPAVADAEPEQQSALSVLAAPPAEPAPQKAPQVKSSAGEPPRSSVAGTPSAPAGPPQERFSRRSRRRRPHHKGFPDSKYARQQPELPSPAPRPTSAPAPPPVEPPIILPGESLAKYKGRTPPEPVQAQTENMEEIAGTNLLEDTEKSPSGSATAGAAVMESVPSHEEQPEQEEQSEPLISQSLAIAPEITEPAISDTTEEQMNWEGPAVPVAAPDLDTVQEQAQADVPEIENPTLGEAPFQPQPEQLESSPDAISAEPGAAASEAAVDSEESSIPEAAVPESPLSDAENPEGNIEPESMAVKSEPVEGAPESAPPQRATMRERNRNPRYMRRGRWATRREGPPDAVRPPGSRPPRERETPQQPLIADLLKEGQEILVQIAKEPLGKKGARITSHIALPGRYLVFMPTVNHVGVSRKIASDEERQRLKRIILDHSKNIPGGFIVRTAGEGHSEEDFRQDILYLSKLWAEVKGQAEKSSAPVLLHHDLNLVLRTLRDQISEDFSAVWVDSEQEYEKILSLVSKFQPALVNRVKLYSKDVPLFDELGIQEEINKALKPKVWLKSGGYIVINQTEALVAIDVNTGKFVGKSNRLEDTIVKTNVEAIREIVRQIRLRDLGGIIVVDFIDMDERKNRQKVMVAMEEALRSDRSPSKILSFNKFGLVAITRKRVRQSLERTLCQPCAYCGGSGLVKSVMTVCYEILSEARKLASQLERKQITLRVNPEVGRALKARDNTILQEIEEMTGKAVIIRHDATLHIETFDFN